MRHWFLKGVLLVCTICSVLLLFINRHAIEGRGATTSPKETTDSIEKAFGLTFSENHSLSYVPETSLLYKTADVVVDVELISNEDYEVMVVDDGGPPDIFQQLSFKTTHVLTLNKPHQTLPTKANYLLYQHLVPNERQLKIPKGHLRLFLSLQDNCVEGHHKICADVMAYAASQPGQPKIAKPS